MTPANHNERSLDTLSAMVNLVLIQTASVLRDPSKRDPRHVIHTNSQMRDIIPTACERFHSALDEIEIEILRAKATMSRDLAASRTRRLEQERQASTEKSRISAQSSQKVDAPAVPTATENNTHPTDDTPGIEPNPAMTKSTSPKHRDSSSGEVNTSESDHALPFQENMDISSSPPQERRSNLSTLAGALGVGDGVHEESDVNTYIPSVMENAAPAGKGGTGETAVEVPELTPQDPPLTAGATSNFESMLQENAGGDGDNDMSFDLDFSTNITGDANMLDTTDAFGNSALDAPPALPAQTAGLPADALTSHAQAPSDLPNTAAVTDAELTSLLGNGQNETEVEDLAQYLGMPTGEGASGVGQSQEVAFDPDSTFDDLFYNEGGEGTEGGEFDATIWEQN